jgi:hypothetical protein
MIIMDSEMPFFPDPELDAMFRRLRKRIDESRYRVTLD